MSILARVAASPARFRRLAIAFLLVAAVLASYAAVQFSFADPQLAAWWPAAGFAAAAGMLSRGRERWIVVGLVALSTGAGNLLAGRDPGFALLLGVGNTVEVVIIATLLAHDGRPSPIATLRQAVRFISVALLAAIGSGIVLSIVASVFIDRDPLEAFAQLSASHASATLVMLPFLLVPASVRLGSQWVELLLQSTLLCGMVAFVFWPGNTWPVAFTPLVAFLWSAFRFPILVSATQMLYTAIAVIVLTTIGGGPFAAFDDGGRTPVVLIQLFLLVYSIAALVVCAARADWFVVVHRLRAQEELLREGIVTADVGIVIAERTGLGLSVVARNERARRAVGEHGPPFGVDEIDRVLEAEESAQVVFERDGRTFDASISERRSDEGPTLVVIVITDATERDERERMALDSAEQLRRLNAQKDDFISAVSHELRTPVTSILGFSEQLDESNLPADIAQAGTVIARNARRLADVIEDVLELSRLSALGGTLPSPTPVDLLTLADECAADAEGLALARRVTVEVDAPREPVVVHSRLRDLERVCANLLSNAVKFSHDDGLVTIEIARLDDGARIRVIDRGLGVPEEHRDMIWQRFARAPLDSHRAVPGTGLGLPIVKALVESRLGGSVALTETPGGGTTVEVRLPAAAPAVSSAQVGA